MADTEEELVVRIKFGLSLKEKYEAELRELGEKIVEAVKLMGSDEEARMLLPDLYEAYSIKDAGLRQIEDQLEKLGAKFDRVPRS